jgi:hypothetical protein
MQARRQNFHNSHSEKYHLFCLPHHGRWFQTGTLADIEKTEATLKNFRI